MPVRLRGNEPNMNQQVAGKGKNSVPKLSWSSSIVVFADYIWSYTVIQGFTGKSWWNTWLRGREKWHRKRVYLRWRKIISSNCSHVWDKEMQMIVLLNSQSCFRSKACTSVCRGGHHHLRVVGLMIGKWN